MYCAHCTFLLSFFMARHPSFLFPIRKILWLSRPGKRRANPAGKFSSLPPDDEPPHFISVSCSSTPSGRANQSRERMRAVMVQWSLGYGTACFRARQRIAVGCGHRLAACGESRSEKKWRLEGEKESRLSHATSSKAPGITATSAPVAGPQHFFTACLHPFFASLDFRHKADATISRLVFWKRISAVEVGTGLRRRRSCAV